MRILFVNYEYPPIGGGGANANKYLFREFAGFDDLQIDFVTSGLSDVLEIKDIYPNIKGYFLPVKKKELHFWKEAEVIRFLWQARKQCKKLLRNNKYDLCHCFFGFPSGLLGLLNRKKVPYIISLRGSDVPGFNVRFQAHYIILTPLFRQIWKKSKAVIANSNGLCELALQSAPKQQIEIIPNGIDTNEFSPSTNKNNDTFNVLCVSRLIERKGIHFLLDAWKKLIEKNQNSKLFIVGEGDMKTVLLEKSEKLGITNSVNFTGRLVHEKTIDMYKKADVFVLPSMNEGMSNTILEAMACGLPIVSTGVGGSDELFSDNAKIIPKKDSDAIVNVLFELANDKTLREKMGRISRINAEKMSWKSVAMSYYECYKKM